MWPKTFGERLASWTELRRRCETGDVESAVTIINSWWFVAPWQPYQTRPTRCGACRGG